MNDHFYNKYKHKIVNENFLISLRKKKKKKTLIMCHGVFDVVHPGHVRHLVYAKSKADFLVVSLTADKFINICPSTPGFTWSFRYEYDRAFQNFY